MAYATVQDVLDRTTHTYTEDERTVISHLLDDAAIIIDAFNTEAAADAKKVVSCRMVIRALGDDGEIFPMGASQGSMSAGGYSQSWTMGSGGGTGEIYLGKTEKLLLGAGNRIGSYSPTQEMVVNCLD